MILLKVDDGLILIDTGYDGFTFAKKFRLLAALLRLQDEKVPVSEENRELLVYYVSENIE